MRCLECKKAEMESEDGLHYICPKCGYKILSISMSSKELRQLGRQAYLDGRHWNHGGGLNK